MKPGEIQTADRERALNVDRDCCDIEVINTGDRPIQVGSHYHFYETNEALQFERQQALGRRLNIPAGTAIRFEPGQGRTVSLVALAGKRHVAGFQGKIMHSLDKEGDA